MTIETVGADASCDLAPLPATAGAQWLPPLQNPPGSDDLFRPGPVDPAADLPIIARYDAVRAALVNRDGILHRTVPFEVIPADARHCTLYASWGLDGVAHKVARGSLTAINLGSSAAAREFTGRLTTALTQRLLREPPPWDLARVIYEVSYQLVLRFTLGAPVLLPAARRLRELVRDHVAAPGGFFGIRRDLAAESILAEVVYQRHDLPDGPARHLVELHLRAPEAFTLRHVLGQLWLLVVSSETQATQAATLIATLLGSDWHTYARTTFADGNTDAINRLVDESGRRGVVFPASLAIPAQPYPVDDCILPAGRPVLISYAAANLDPAAFHDPQAFDPVRPRDRKHLAFGVGDHRCQGEVGAGQFVADVVAALLHALPVTARLHNGLIHRESGISMSVAALPVS